MQFTDLQLKVFEAAKAQLQTESWYRGVCLDNFPDDRAIKDDFDGSVEQVILETGYWDAPSFLEGEGE